MLEERGEDTPEKKNGYVSQETFLNNKYIWVICFTDFIEFVTKYQFSLTRENYSRIGILFKLHPSQNGLNINVKG